MPTACGRRARPTISARRSTSSPRSGCSRTPPASIRTEQPLTMSLERVEDMLQLDSRAGLARLSADTGGFLVEGSNNLGAAFRRIDEDNQFHYLLTYSPKKAAFDGKFRAIQVTVRRPGVQVFARKGYRAVHSPRLTDTIELRPRRRWRCSIARPLPNAFPIYACRFQLSRCRAPGTDTRTGARRAPMRSASTSTRGEPRIRLRRPSSSASATGRAARCRGSASSTCSPAT